MVWQRKTAEEMGEDLDPLVVQRTQQKLGKYIQKPQLTDKLLRRPPFRFLHDIVTSVSSNFMTRFISLPDTHTCFIFLGY